MNLLLIFMAYCLSGFFSAHVYVIGQYLPKIAPVNCMGYA